MNRRAPAAPVLRGRDTVLSALDAGVAAALNGRGATLLIEGHCGSGKTRMLHEARCRAERAGMRALFGEALDGQHALPFAPLLAATVGSVPPIGDPDAVRALGASTDLRFWVVHDLRAALASAASRAPLAVLLDDLNRADDGTLMALRALTAGLRHVGVLWVLSFCHGRDGGPAVREALSRLEEEGARRLHLAPLHTHETAAIVEDFAGAPGDPGLRALAEQAVGNPSVLLELLRGLREENRLEVGNGRATVRGGPLPRRLLEVFAERLGRLGAEARRLVPVAATLPRRFTVAELAGMLERRAADLVGPIEETVRAELLISDGGHLRFRHDLLRQAARESLPAPVRQALEAEAASAGRREIATSPPRNSRPASRDARLAYDLWTAGDVEPAAAEARQVLDRAGDDQARGFALLTLAGVAVSRGAGAEAALRLDELRNHDHADAGQSLRKAHIANLLHCLGRTDEAAEVLAAAQRGACRDGDGPLISLCAQISGMLSLAAGRLDDARCRAESMALPVDETGGNDLAGVIQMITYAGLATYTGEAGPRHAARALARRAQSIDRPVSRRWAARVLAELTARDEPFEAIRLLDDDPLLPAALPTPADQHFLAFAARLAAETRDRGLADRARAAATTLIADGTAPPVFAGVSAYVLGVVDHDLDRLRSAARTLQGVRPLLHAAACEQIGGMLARRGRLSSATTQWNLAMETYAVCDATAAVRRLAERLRVSTRSSRPVAGWAALTEMERKVVRVVAGGATNREAALKLFLSPHTISTHLRRAFVKLDINSRVQLANRLHDIGG
ncbi:helix-turn-helix transcriptional regulator [Paractinoplanes deccanensis]|uniref:Helix-turn-helix transcriptional regulator n=1 Tax=Paractinoplanes deccanensis TaxID=113561 RepID=A0ABQ3YJR7_9ACTN|nr:AAA family ATPase [Actinoplanes deccanensis]GID80232.1 helix-turn-helix transcriptional regulator [Actinoplanes deccanensis]